MPRWKAKLGAGPSARFGEAKRKLAATADADDARERLATSATKLRGAGATGWTSTIIEIIISEAQNEVARLQEVGLRHHPASRP